MTFKDKSNLNTPTENLWHQGCLGVGEGALSNLCPAPGLFRGWEGKVHSVTFALNSKPQEKPQGFPGN